jgi:YlmC/YmxH family sporulation protein
MKFSELRRKEVVNILDGKSLGCICDLIIDPCNGQILSMLLPGPFRLAAIFSVESTYCVPWSNICKLGEDVILVKVEPTLPNYR